MLINGQGYILVMWCLDFRGALTFHLPKLKVNKP